MLYTKFFFFCLGHLKLLQKYCTGLYNTLKLKPVLLSFFYLADRQAKKLNFYYLSFCWRFQTNFANLSYLVKDSPKKSSLSSDDVMVASKVVLLSCERNQLKTTEFIWSTYTSKKLWSVETLGASDDRIFYFKLFELDLDSEQRL